MRQNGTLGAAPGAAPGSPAWRLDRLDRILDALLDGTLDREAGELVLTVIGLCMVPFEEPSNRHPGSVPSSDTAPDPDREARRAVLLKAAAADDAARPKTPRRRAMAAASLENLVRAGEARTASAAARKAENAGVAVLQHPEGRLPWRFLAGRPQCKPSACLALPP